ncbi:MAG: glycosyltransferase [Bacteroidota bacterium]|nr:glycosyltransferase [Bacteroidota bacterium]
MSAQLKVLHVASWYPSEVHPSLGNFIARHVEAVATACEVEVWAPVPVRGSASSVVKMRDKNGTELREIEGQTWTVRRLYHEATRPQLVGVARSVASAASKMDWTPDVVHVHVAYPAGSSAVAWAKKWGVPVVLTEHWTAYHDFGAVPWWRRRVIRDVVKRTDAVCPVSADLGEAMDAAVPGMGLVHVVPNVVDTSLFKPAEEETLAGVPVGATRRRLEGHAVARVLHVSSMNDDQKNITGLLEALAPLLKANPALKATFVGGELARLDGYRSWVKAQGLEGRIVFTGPLGTAEVVKYMQSHDVLVLNSRRENFPCVIAEAWACGIPVMSTDVGGIREHLPPGLSKRGFLLPAGAGEVEWKEAWMQVSQTTWPEESLRKYAETHFSMAAVGAAYKEVYLGLLG